jgi:hypothetical protein
MNRFHDKILGWPWRRTLVAGFLLTAVGCGLRDYEAHIDEQQHRLKFLDEDTRALGVGLSWIDKPKYEIEGDKDKGRKYDYWPFDVFLRLPKDMRTSSKDNYPASGNPKNQYDLRLFRFADGNFKFLIAAGLIYDAEKAKDSKSGPPKWTWTPKKFRDDVLLALNDYYLKEYKVAPRFPREFTLQRLSKQQPISERDPLPPPVTYDAGAFSDEFNPDPNKSKARFDYYFFQQGDKQVAIIVQYPITLVTDDDTQRGLLWSLASLDVNPATIGAKRAALNDRKANQR